MQLFLTFPTYWLCHSARDAPFPLLIQCAYPGSSLIPFIFSLEVDHRTPVRRPYSFNQQPHFLFGRLWWPTPTSISLGTPDCQAQDLVISSHLPSISSLPSFHSITRTVGRNRSLPRSFRYHCGPCYGTPQRFEDPFYPRAQVEQDQRAQQQPEQDLRRLRTTTSARAVHASRFRFDP
ncbi:hypothetical protein EDB92DRAFT_506302 [Lactarius akahatsu]|uniref:Uncharacterized protein n=1 Tax=Lactarius akahatsu TaxID=416441 RepID=A0AAD4LQW5_9AGAM|nr:hypothetical protein EDB92DRAFT_506302 [Lactarius akahatsu]